MIYWIINLIVIGLASLLFFRKWGSDFSSIIYWSALLAKLIAGLVVGWIFSHYYSGADTFNYFHQARSLASQSLMDYLLELFSSSTYETTNKPRVLFFIKILSLFASLSGSSYWISSLYLSLISFFAFWWAVVRMYRAYPNLKPIIIICFLFIPTVVFWSSGILKDTITSAALVVAVTSIITLYRFWRLTFLEVLWTILALFLLLKLKHYLLITFLLFVGLLFFLHYINQANSRTKMLAILILLVTLIGTQFIHPYFNIQRLPLTIYENNQTIIQKTDTKDELGIDIQNPDWKSVLLETPKAIKTGLFRPSIFDRTNAYGWFHKVENLLLLFLIILSILISIKEKPPIDFPLTVAAIFSILILATLLTLSTPNFGSLVRYKNAFMPFYFLLSSILPFQYLNTRVE